MSHDSKGERRYTEFPLTNHNLRHFSGQSLPRSARYIRRALSAGQASSGLALDMDGFAKDQQRLAHLQTWAMPYEDISTYEGDDSDYGFGELNPSLECEDDTQSVDDVFIDVEKTQWPNIDVLEEFIAEEIEDISHSEDVSPLASPPAEAVLFGPPTYASPSISAGGVSAAQEPLLNNYRVNDMPQTDLNLLRVTPKPINPWEQVPQVKKKDSPSIRFTYFREDKEKTIHSATLAGLVAGDTNVPIKTRLKELFVPSYYCNDGERLDKLDKQAPATPAGLGLAPPLAKTTPKVPSSSNLQSMMLIEGDDSETTPFWLDILDPTEEEMKALSKTFNIHPLTTEDIYLGEGREKVEVFRNYYFVSFTSFDVVYERRILREREKEKKLEKLKELQEHQQLRRCWPFGGLKKLTTLSRDSVSVALYPQRKVRLGELVPLNMYMVVFRNAILTFHMSQTPHPINVRRRARLLKDHINVLSDWISYALIDDITDSFAPLISLIEDEVNAIEDEILRMQLGNDLDDDLDDDMPIALPSHPDVKWRRNLSQLHDLSVFYKPRKRLKLVVNMDAPPLLHVLGSLRSLRSLNLGVLMWKRQGDMLRRIGECRKRVMLVMRLLVTKADVVRGFSKKFKETHGGQQQVLMYLGDIQDHIVTMVQALSHYEKLLARFHANYLAQINIDMTKVSNETNDFLGKLTVMGTVVLPLNVITGLWGMNCLVPGQTAPGLTWFYSIVAFMIAFSVFAFQFAQRLSNKAGL